MNSEVKGNLLCFSLVIYLPKDAHIALHTISHVRSSSSFSGHISPLMTPSTMAGLNKMWPVPFPRMMNGDSSPAKTHTRSPGRSAWKPSPARPSVVKKSRPWLAREARRHNLLRISSNIVVVLCSPPVCLRNSANFSSSVSQAQSTSRPRLRSRYREAAGPDSASVTAPSWSISSGKKQKRASDPSERNVRPICWLKRMPTIPICLPTRRHPQPIIGERRSPDPPCGCWHAHKCRSLFILHQGSHLPPHPSQPPRKAGG